MTRELHPENSRDFIVANFHTLETQLVQCMDYIPYIDQNQDVVSPKFVPVLLDACSLIDSVLKSSTDASKRHTFKDYAIELEGRLELEDATTLALVAPLQLLRPFKGWTHAPPPWWQAHNLVKHDRMRNYSAATYAHTFSAMAGLHQLLARSWAFLGNLTRAGWFNEADEQFAELAAARAAGCGPPALPVQTSLFVSPIRDDLVDWSSDSPQIHPWDFTERVKNHVWEWEGY